MPTPDWRVILAKYIQIVVRNEGVHFLYEDEWSAAEWAAFQELEREQSEWWLKERPYADPQ